MRKRGTFIFGIHALASVNQMWRLGGNQTLLEGHRREARVIQLSFVEASDMRYTG
jgi:hypothetical protein